MRCDYGIIGGGLSGCLLAYYLLQQGKKVCLIEHSTIGSGASGTPLAMMNPATGRFAKKGTNSVESIAQIEALQKLSPFSTAQDYIQIRKILRPCFDSEIAHKTYQNYLSDDWGPGIAEWLTSDEVKEQFPLINSCYGALVVHKGYVVHPKKYLHHLVEWLKDIPGFTLLEAYKDLEAESDLRNYVDLPNKRKYFVIRGSDAELQADKLVHCTGAEEIINKMIPGVIVKGQTLQFQLMDPVKDTISSVRDGNNENIIGNNWSSLLKKYAISAQGYLCSLDGRNMVMGSTYEHRYTRPEPDAKGKQYLKNKLNRIHDRLSNEIVNESMWAGLRFSTPDRMPIMDELPTYKGHYVFRGLGSKGLLYSHYYAKVFSKYLCGKGFLSKEVRLSRFK